MSSKPNTKMAIENRAKQFMPFSALKGLNEALQSKEKILVDKIELSEERSEELDYKMKQLQVGLIATIVYFNKGEYIKISGIVAKIDTTSRILQIVDNKINFDDILDICIN